ncbi:type II toxin-antitoxin system RelE/ParE family toxin [bacterium]|nr:type II toxin-antitoxin system RelE/ParE family toxin [bacterium]
MNKINLIRKSLKQRRKVHSSDARAIVSSVGKLVSFPKAKNVKKLTKHQYSYRLRVGDDRVFFEFDGEVKIVTIEEVKKRDERTY